MGEAIIKTIEQERGKQRIVNQSGADGADGDAANCVSDQLGLADLQKELDKRVDMMRSGATENGVTDQARVYDHIIGCLERGEYLRLMIQVALLAPGAKLFVDSFLLASPLARPKRGACASQY